MEFCLIISQYYHSYHTFIVKKDENFIENARKFTIELDKYKGNNGEVDIGDLADDYVKPDRTHYNVNSSGDIYFRISNYCNYLKDIAADYRLREYKNTRQYIKKDILHDVYEYHNYEKVKEILEKYFEIM